MRCPTCKAADLARNRGGASFRGPTHLCPSCGGKFRAMVLTSQMWKPVAILIVGGALFIGIGATHLLAEAPPLLRIVVLGGVAGLWWGLTFRALRRAVEFRACG